jgi:hypothetical protein
VKIALYIEDGLDQVVLHPEGDAERLILARLHDGTRSLSVVRGEFYACMGGWVRHGSGDSSTIIVLRRVEAPAEDTTCTT